MSFLQYLKDTRGELHHVAWPTRVQTIVYTALVITLSVVVSLYLGVFDYLFTTGLSKGLEYLPQDESSLQVSTTSSPIEIKEIETSTEE
ncbi:preprotein translocase subunit SecE [Candidatus Kaiserbacteria bacterium]|nr:preprotein translocase subunit SecE [Candidatus Kaiserbacteria bacterium]